MKERRIENVEASNQTIMDQLTLQNGEIEANRTSIDYLATKFDKLETKLDPMLEIMGDVATVGRFGKMIGKITIWFASIVVAFGILWAAAAKWFGD